MRPIIEKQKFEIRHALYIVLIIICVIAIGVGIYMQFFKDEKLSLIFKVGQKEVDKEIIELKENFLNIFTNDLEVINEYDGEMNKILQDNDIIILGYELKEHTDEYILDIKLPYFNIDNESLKKVNKDLRDTFKYKSESVIASESEDIIYNVRYKAYQNKNILSLIILSELKEGENNQRIILLAYNFDLKENKLISINNVLSEKNISVEIANKKIKEEINLSQEKNIKLKELGYEIDVRDANSDTYKIENAKQFFLGEKGYLYVLYPYGNDEFTSEMDIVIFK